ncbi:hypothetical protein DFH11DRAFT_1069631 [Phellopilus nigrolimitatus]|nr:hypothetical protein DFH11DRAFT_1069631 [Phellopilus nigrolimitatus]
MFVSRNFEVDPANDPSKKVARYKPLFVFLQVFGGQIGLPLFVGTMIFSRSVKRHLTLVNFCVSWIIYSVVYCLSIYHSGDRRTGLSHRTCVTQAAMVHGVVPLAVTAYCALHIQVWLGLRAVFNEDPWLQKQRKKLLITMIFAPYAVFFAFFIGSLAIVLQHPELLDRSGSYYCTVNYNPLVFAVPGYAADIIAIMIILEVIIGFTLVRHWRAVRNSRRLSAASLSMIARIAVFSVYGFATLAACAAFLARSLSVWPYLVQASLPTAIFLTFGTRRDVWRAWFFCLKRDKNTQTISVRVTLDTTVTSDEREGSLEDDIDPKPRSGLL